MKEVTTLGVFGRHYTANIKKLCNGSYSTRAEIGAVLKRPRPSKGFDVGRVRGRHLLLSGSINDGCKNTLCRYDNCFHVDHNDPQADKISDCL